MPQRHKNDFQPVKHDLIKQSKIDTIEIHLDAFFVFVAFCFDPCHYMLENVLWLCLIQKKNIDDVEYAVHLL